MRADHLADKIVMAVRTVGPPIIDRTDGMMISVKFRRERVRARENLSDVTGLAPGGPLDIRVKSSWGYDQSTWVKRGWDLDDLRSRLVHLIRGAKDLRRREKRNQRRRAKYKLRKGNSVVDKTDRRRTG